MLNEQSQEAEGRQVAVGLVALTAALLLLPCSWAFGAEGSRLFGAPPIGAVLAEDEPAPTQPHEEVLLDFTPALSGISERLRPEVKQAYDLGRAGALYAARQRFVAVLRKVALAKDSAAGVETHSEALAEGLHALDEADDFLPRGDALEAELDAQAIARSHSTPVVRLSSERRVTPHRAVSLYSQHAADRLAAAVADEQAGSMALYGLGKTYARLSTQGGDPYAERKSAVAYRAALLAHQDNYLAANELGVFLARAGRHEQALTLLSQAAEHNEAPAAVYANLAMVQQQTGRVAQAKETRQRQERVASAAIASGEVSRRHGVEWVAAEAFGGGAAPGASASRDARQAAVADQQQGESGFFTRIRQAAGWSATGGGRTR